MDGAKHTPAVEELLAHAGWMRSLARGIVGDRELAEDVLQDAWVAALDRPPAPRSSAGLRAWLERVVENLARSRRRREAARGAVERRAARPEAVAGELEAPDVIGVIGVIDRMQLQRELADALLELREPYRSAVVWRHIDGLSAEEIGRRGTCSPEAARQRVARGLAELRRRLERPGPGGHARLLALAAVARAPESHLSASLAGAFLMSKTVWSLASIAAGLALSWAAWSVLREPAAAPLSSMLADESISDPSPPLREMPAELAVQGPASQAARSAVAPPAAERLRASLVVRDRNGQPIEGVAVGVLGAEPWGTTGSDGRFRLDGALFELSTESIAAVATHDDFLSAELELLANEERELVLARKPRVEIELVLPPSQGGGRPAGPWSGSVWVRDSASGEVVELGVQFDEGALGAPRLPVGRLERAQGRARGHASGSAAFDVPLEPDGVARIQLELTDGIEVAGRVIDAASQAPIPDATVWAEEIFFDDDSTADWTKTDAQGRFELHGLEADPLESGDLPPGNYLGMVISAQAEGYQGKPFEWKVFQVNDTGRYAVEIELTRASASLRGHLIGDGGAPPTLVVWAVQANGQFVNAVAHGGSFEFQELTPGDLALFASNAQFEGEPFVCARTELNLEPGEQAEVELSLERGTGTLSGSVLDAAGSSLAGAQVTAHLIANMGWIAWEAFSWSSTSSPGGEFSFTGLPSGLYDVQLTALPPGWCALEGHWKVELEVGGSATGGELVASECTSVEGWVELGALDPAALRVRARGPEDRDLDVESPVAADATFRLTNLPSVETEIVLLEGDVELCRVPIGSRGAHNLELRPGG